MGGEGKMGPEWARRINEKIIQIRKSKLDKDLDQRFGQVFRETCLKQGVLEERVRRFMESPDTEALETMSVLVELRGSTRAEKGGDGLPSLQELDAALLTPGESSEMGTVVTSGYRLFPVARIQGLKEIPPWSEDGSWSYVDQVMHEDLSTEGRAYEYLRWRPCREVSLIEVGQYFFERQFGGSAEAFLALATQDQRDGVVVGFPKTGYWKRPDEASVLVLKSCVRGSVRTFGLSRINERDGEKFAVDDSFVGFRPV